MTETQATQLLTEADTCRELVTPAIRRAGWGQAPYAIGEQHQITDGRIRRWIAWERYTLWLRTVWFPVIETGYRCKPLRALWKLFVHIKSDDLHLRHSSAGLVERFPQIRS